VKNELEHTNPWQVIDAQRAEIEHLKRDLEAARDIIESDVKIIDELRLQIEQLRKDTK